MGGSLTIVFALLGVAGLANAVAQPAINLFMADQVPIDRQGLAFGIKQSAIPGAILVSGLALPALALPLGWRATFAICGGLVLVVALVARQRRPRLSRPRPSDSRLRARHASCCSSPWARRWEPRAPMRWAPISSPRPWTWASPRARPASWPHSASAASLAVRLALGARADRRRDYGYGTVAVLLVLGSAGFLLMTIDARRSSSPAR